MHRIREKRRSLNLTMKELGKIVGVSEGAISHYETGRREPDPDMLNKIACALGVSVDYLLGRDDTFVPDQDNAPAYRATRRAEGHEILEQLSDENYQAMLTLLRSMTEKKG